LASGVVLGCSEHQGTALSQVFRWRLEPKQVTASDPNNDKTHAYVKFNLSFTKANKGRAGREIFIPYKPHYVLVHRASITRRKAWTRKLDRNKALEINGL